MTGEKRLRRSESGSGMWGKKLPQDGRQ